MEGSFRLRYENSGILGEQKYIRKEDIDHRVFSMRPVLAIYSNDGAWELRAAPNIYYDTAYERVDIYNEQDKDEFSSYIDWRDTYVSHRGENNVLRVGRQVISWGKMDALRLADRINPVNLERYLVPYLYDYEEGIQHVTAVSWDVFSAQSGFQVVVVPEYQQSRLPSKNNRFSPYYAYRGYDIAADKKPDASQPEYGFRYQKFIDDAELSFYFWEGYPDIPPIGILLDGNGHPQELAYHYGTETYVGMSYSSIWQHKVLRFELGMIHDSVLMMDQRRVSGSEEIQAFNKKRGLSFSDMYLAAAGVETELWSPAARLIMQYYYEELAKPDKPVYAPLRRDGITFSFSQLLGDYDRYQLRFDGQYWTSDGSYLLRAGFRDQFLQHWQWNVELFQLVGDADTTFGMYEHSQYTFRLQYEI